MNHPHIAAIYGLEESNGQQALVLELVEGVTLAERIAKGPLSLVDALTTARQVADALHAAHAKGIVHRDLKPRLKCPAGRREGPGLRLGEVLETRCRSRLAVHNLPGERRWASSWTEGYMLPNRSGQRGPRTDRGASAACVRDAACRRAFEAIGLERSATSQKSNSLGRCRAQAREDSATHAAVPEHDIGSARGRSPTTHGHDGCWATPARGHWSALATARLVRISAAHTRG